MAATYELEVCTRNGPVKSLTNATLETVRWDLMSRGLGQLDFSMSQDDPDVSFLSLVEHEVRCTIEGVTTPWQGPVWSDSQDSRRVKFMAQGVESYLTRRFIDRSSLLYDDVAEGYEQLQIGLGLIQYAQGIPVVQAGGTQITTVRREATATSGIVYTEEWAYGTNLGGASNGDFAYNGAGGTVGSAARAERTFNGVGCKVQLLFNNNCGLVDIYLDEVLKLTVDMYGALGQVYTWDSGDLEYGAHIVSVRPNNTKQAASQGYYVILDYIETREGGNGIDPLKSFNVTAAGVQPSGIKRLRKYSRNDHGNILDALNEFSELVEYTTGEGNGFDWEIVCGRDNSRVWTPYFPKKGIYRGDYALEWGRNISDFNVDEDAKNITTKTYWTGANTGNLRLEANYEDEEASARYTQMVSVVSGGDQADPEELNNKARAHTEQRKRPTVHPDLTAVQVPGRLLGKIFVGDSVPVVISRGRTQINDIYRIGSLTWNVRPDTLSLALIPKVIDV